MTMGYCVVEQCVDGSLRVLAEGVHGSRGEAKEALERVLSSGAESVTGEVFIVDLSDAIPVVIVVPPPVLAPAEGPSVAARTESGFPSGREESVVDTGPAMVPLPEPFDAVPFTAFETDLLEASVPDTGVPVFRETPGVSATEQAISSISDEPMVFVTTDVPGIDPLAAQTAPVTVTMWPADLPVDVRWGMESADAAEPKASVPEPDVLAGTGEWVASDTTFAKAVRQTGRHLEAEDEQLEPVVESPEPSLEEFSGQPGPGTDPASAPARSLALPDDLTAPVNSEPFDAAVPPPGEREPWPWIAEYAPSGRDPGLRADAPSEEGLSLEVTAKASRESRLEPEPEPAVPDASEISGKSPDFDDIAQFPETSGSTAAVDLPGFAASGEMQLDEYSCEDCVYTDACPRSGQVAPAECGAFQWRAN